MVEKQLAYLENIDGILSDILKTKSRNDIEEILLKHIISKSPYIKGVLVVKNAKNIGLMYFTAR